MCAGSSSTENAKGRQGKAKEGQKEKVQNLCVCAARARHEGRRKMHVCAGGGEPGVQHGRGRGDRKGREGKAKRHAGKGMVGISRQVRRSATPRHVELARGEMLKKRRLRGEYRRGLRQCSVCVCVRALHEHVLSPLPPKNCPP